MEHFIVIKALMCPKCGSTRIEGEFGGMTGRYKCDDCGYVGVLVLQADDDADKKETSLNKPSKQQRKQKA